MTGMGNTSPCALELGVGGGAGRLGGGVFVRIWSIGGSFFGAGAGGGGIEISLGGRGSIHCLPLVSRLRYSVVVGSSGSGTSAVMNR